MASRIGLQKRQDTEANIIAGAPYSAASTERGDFFEATDTGSLWYVSPIDGTISRVDAPNENEQLSVTAATITVPNLPLAPKLLMHYRNGVLQPSNYFGITAGGVITPTAASVEATYVDEDLRTVWW